MRTMFVTCTVLGVLGCGPRTEDQSAGRTVLRDRPDRVLIGATAAQARSFDEGDALFETTFRTADGLGPLFIRSSCAACHRDDGRGPGLVTKLVRERGDGGLPWGNTARPYVAAGATRPLDEAAYRDLSVRASYRLPPAVFGRGYLEAIDDAEIERLATAAARGTDGVRGRIHRLADGRIGRFGLKARIGTLDQFTADAFQGDMGLTSPSLPDEPPNPEGLHDDQRPGVDLDAATILAVTDYVRLLEIPTRAPASARAGDLFVETACARCHTPSLRTRADHPVKALAGIAAPVFTDLLLHDMGAALSDGITDGDAGPREWRTPPLIGLRFLAAYLHDGRARTIEEAIEAHGGEASEGRDSVLRFRRLSAQDRAALLAYVGAL